MILDFGIKNFRSFDDKGVFLNDLQKINIFIGKNNSGKSNFIRFLTLLSQNSFTHDRFPDFQNENIHKKNGNKTIFTFYLRHEDVQLSPVVNYNDTNFYVVNYLPNPFLVDFALSSTNSDLRISLPELDEGIPIDVLRKMFHKNKDNNKALCLQNIKSEIYILALEKIKIYNDLIFISDFRFIQEGNKVDTSNSQLNSANIISRMREMQVPDSGNEHLRCEFDKIQDIVRRLLSIKDLTIEIPSKADKIILNMHGDIRQDLKSFGTGIHQLIVLCCALVIYSDKIICIEEPEIHLHPELQRKFLDFLIWETTNTYFISTHSNTFLNLYDHVSIYHVQNDGIRTTCEKVEKSMRSYQLLDDLGYKASDLLQSNGIVWVEGPSDRNLINKWIKLIDPTLKEGLHYSIMFYGGRLLANCSFDPDFFEDNLIPLLLINRNAYVVIDRDNSKKLNETKSRINAEIGEGKCWITKGREIENYINEKVIKKWLTDRKAYGEKKITLDSNQKFGEIIEELDSTKKIKYDQHKNSHSLDISNFFDVDDLDYTDLKYQIEQLIIEIKSWN